MDLELDSMLRIQRDLAIKLSETSDLEIIYRLCIETIMKIGDFDGGLIYNVESIGSYELIYEINVPRDIIDFQEKQSRDMNQIQQMMAGEPLYIENLDTLGSGTTDYKSHTVLPIMYQGKVVSLIMVFSKISSEIALDTREALETVVTQMGGAIARAKAEQAYIEGEKQLRNITEEIAEGIAVTIDFKNVWVNSAFCNIFGYTREELLGQGPDFVIEPSYIPSLLEYANNFLDRGTKISNRFELKGVRKDKSIIDIDVIGKLIDFAGKKAIQIIIHDISDKKKTEQELRDSEEKYNSIWHAVFVARDIQEKKEQELKLRESEEKFRLIAENSSDLIFLYDKNLGMIYGNEQVLGKKLGWMLEEFQAFKMNDFIHPDDVISFFSAINYVKKRTATSQQREIRLINKLNEYRWFQADISSYEDDNGQLRILTIFRDINERKMQELQLRDSEERYRLMNENVNDMILLMDSNDQILYCNEQALLKKLGYTLAELNNLRMSELFSREYYPVVMSYVKELFKNPGSSRKEEMQLTRKDGKQLWFDVEGLSYINEKNEVTLLIVARDIQDKKENESKLIDTNERLRIVTENIQDIVVIVNTDYEFEYVNEAIKQFGVDPASVIGQKINFLIYRDDVSKVENLIQTCFEQGIVRGPFRSRFENLNRSIGETRWFEAVGKTFHDNDGNIKILVIARDISERIKVEEILESENKLLKEIDKLQKDFVLNATHELKTPLSIIIGATDFLIKYYDEVPEPKRLDFLNSIHKGSIRLKQLIENLLDYSRIESGRLQLENLEDTDIVGLVHSAIQSISYLINRRQQNINMDMPSTLIAKIDKFRIEQVITNLISNAVKNTQSGGRIEINLEQKNDQIQFSVIDNGIGLTREEISRLFQKFGKIERKSLNADIDIQGTGLGLFISKEIIEMHGGKIWAESKGRNSGSTFSFTIPVSNKD